MKKIKKTFDILCFYCSLLFYSSILYLIFTILTVYIRTYLTLCERIPGWWVGFDQTHVTNCTHTYVDNFLKFWKKNLLMFYIRYLYYKQNIFYIRITILRKKFTYLWLTKIHLWCTFVAVFFTTYIFRTKDLSENSTAKKIELVFWKSNSHN